MEEKTECILDQNGIEILVTYKFEYVPADEVDFHGKNRVDGGFNIILTCVELIIANRGIELLPKLTEKQQQYIKDQLSIYD